MSYINVGVDAPHNRTKKALKEGIASNPASVFVYSTSSFGPTFYGSVAEMPEDAKLSVVGPNPALDRKWYATVSRRGTKITVS